MSQRAAQAARFFVPAALLAGLAACSGAATDAPPRLEITPGRVAVLGLSSGAYQATQAHLALGERFSGAVLVAGGPAGCANGQLEMALGPCMTATPSAPEVAPLAARVRERAAAGGLAPLSALEGDRVLVVHAANDATVAPAVGRAAFALYQDLAKDAPGLQLRWDGERAFGHAWPTVDRGVACATGGEPWIAACGIDLAGEAFAWLYGEPAAAAAAEPAGELRRFDQSLFAADEADPVMGDTGLLYLPPACAAGQPCGLLVAFHGCQQSLDQVGEVFARESGLNRWADVHAVAVLYPQARSSYLPLNPKACWDWWGYTGPDYDTRRGAQLRWLSSALDGLGAP